MRRSPGGAFLAALLALVALASPVRAEPEPKVTLVFSSLLTLDPHRVATAAEERAVGALFEGLTVLDAGSTEGAAPGVAARWETAPDGLTWTFHLRPEAKWSDGKPVTAGDFVDTWSRLLSGEREFPNAYLLDGLQGGSAFYRDQRLSERLFRLSTAVGELVRGKGGVSEDEATGFVDESGFRSATAHMTEPEIVQLRALDRPLTSGAVKKIQAALEREAARLKERFDRACARVCKDEGFFAKDDRTLVVRTALPSRHLPRLLAHPGLVPLARKTLSARRGGFDGYELVTNGPYVSKGPEPDGDKVHKLVLEKSPTYWNAAAVPTSRIECWIDIDDALDRWKSGEASWVVHDLGSVGIQGRASLSTEGLARLRKEHAGEFYDVPTSTVYVLAFRCDRPPFDVVDRRRALANAIDRHAAAARSPAARLLPTTRIVAPGVRGAPPDPAPLAWAKLAPEKETPDAKKARVAAAKALLGDTDLSNGISFLALVDGSVEPAVTAVGKHWEDAFGGFAGATLLDRSESYEPQVERATHHALVMPLRPAYDDPLAYLEIWTSGHPKGATGWRSEAYDALVAGAHDASAFARAPVKAATDADPAVAAAAAKAKGGDAQAIVALRAALLQAAERMLLDQAVVVPLFVAAEAGVARATLRGFDVKKPRVPRDPTVLRRLSVEAK
jgi:ABC-type oligopeptide transport system substrate-binding subunit